MLFGVPASRLPEAAGIGRDFVRENYFAVESAEFELEIDKVDVEVLEELYHHVVYRERQLLYFSNLPLGCALYSERGVVDDEGVGDLSALTRKLQGSDAKFGAFM